MKALKKKNLKKRIWKSNTFGFTLSELLIVVAILGILVAVSIPIFAGKTADAEATVCAANI